MHVKKSASFKRRNSFFITSVHLTVKLNFCLVYTISFDNWLCKLSNLMLSVLLLPFLEDILIILNNSIAFTMQTFIRLVLSFIVIIKLLIFFYIFLKLEKIAYSFTTL